MIQSFDLNKMQLETLSKFETQTIDGGRVNWYLIGGVAFGIAAILCTGGMAAAAAGASFCCFALA